MNYIASRKFPTKSNDGYKKIHIDETKKNHKKSKFKKIDYWPVKKKLTTTYVNDKIQKNHAMRMFASNAISVTDQLQKQDKYRKRQEKILNEFKRNREQVKRGSSYLQSANVLTDALMRRERERESNSGFYVISLLSLESHQFLQEKKNSLASLTS